jgi:hypothetical protein
MRHEVKDAAMRRAFLQRLWYCKNVTAANARINVTTRCHLDDIDFAEQVLEFRIGLAESGHTAEITNIAPKVAAEVERHNVVPKPCLTGRRTVEGLAHGNEAIAEAQSVRVHIEVVEIAAATEQLLDVVLPCHEEGIEPCLFEQSNQTARIKWENRGGAHFQFLVALAACNHPLTSRDFTSNPLS